MLSFFPRGVLGEILKLIESVFEGFPSYSIKFKISSKTRKPFLISFVYVPLVNHENCFSFCQRVLVIYICS